MLPAETVAFFHRRCATDHGADALYLPSWSLTDWDDLLAGSSLLTLDRQDVLMRRGEAESSLYLVASGSLEVRSGGGGTMLGPLVREGPGAVLGEIAFFDGGTRSATVWAVAPSRLVALRRPQVEAFADRHPTRGMEWMFALGRVMAWRMRRSEQRSATGAL